MDACAPQGSPTASLESFGYKQELKRSLKLRDLVGYGLAMISPIAPVAVFGYVFNASAGMVPLVYAVGLAAMLFTAWSYITMARAFPIAGSVYAYASRSLGQSAGFIAGWAILLDYLLVPALMYLLSAIALTSVVPAIPKWVWLGVLLVCNGAANLFGVAHTTKVSAFMMMCQLLFLALFMTIAIVAVTDGTAGASFSTAPLINPAGISPGVIFGALSIAALSFLGFDAISTLAEESEGGGRTVGKATIIVLVVAALLFIGQTYIMSLFILGQTSLPSGDATDQASYNIAGDIGGTWLKVLVSLAGGALACIPSALTAQTATSRLLFGMARDGKLPRFLAHVSEGRRVPDRAVLLVSAVTIALMAYFEERVGTLASMINFGALTGFIFVNLSVIAHYTVRQKDGRWGRHLAAPAIGVAFIGYVLWNMEPFAQMAGVAWLSVGLCIFVAGKVFGAAALPIPDAPPSN
ncbi:MAG: APC family permease [Rhodospirillaceae bacterium]|nr:APC family permease [Rhodospirillaceae bacterium]